MNVGKWKYCSFVGDGWAWVNGLIIGFLVMDGLE